MTAEKFRAFGWESVMVDGHNLEELRYAFSKFKKSTSSRPFVVVAQTVRGKGARATEEPAMNAGVDRLGAALGEISEFLKRFARG